MCVSLSPHDLVASSDTETEMQLPSDISRNIVRAATVNFAGRYCRHHHQMMFQEEVSKKFAQVLFQTV